MNRAWNQIGNFLSPEHSGISRARFLALALLLLFTVPAWLSAQEAPVRVQAKTKYSTSAQIGYEMVDSLRFYQLRLIHEIGYKKFGIGLDLDFLFDKHYHLRKADWDHLEDIVDKIYYIKYGSVGDPLYLQVGGFPGISVGHGLSMQDYSNMQLYPELRNTGLLFGASPRWTLKPSFELFSSDVRKNEIMFLTARCNPVADSTLWLLDELSLGASLVTDLDQYGNLRRLVKNQFEDDVRKLKKDAVTIIGAGYTLPLLEKENITLGNYAEMAYIFGNGAGAILPGFYGEFYKILRLSLEYRLYGNEFTPAFFDGHYEEERALQPDAEVADFVTKEDALRDCKRAEGFNGRVDAFLFKKVKLMYAWQNMLGRDLETGRSFWAKISVDTRFRRLENFSLAYNKIKTNSLGIGKFVEPNAEFKLGMTFRVHKRWFVTGKYAEAYKDKNENGSVDWLKETKRSFSVGAKYIY